MTGKRVPAGKMAQQVGVRQGRAIPEDSSCVLAYATLAPMASPWQGTSASCANCSMGQLAVTLLRNPACPCNLTAPQAGSLSRTHPGWQGHTGSWQDYSIPNSRLSNTNIIVSLWVAIPKMEMLPPAGCCRASLAVTARAASGGGFSRTVHGHTATASGPFPRNNRHMLDLSRPPCLA